MNKFFACLLVVLLSACSVSTGDTASVSEKEMPHKEVTIKVDGAVCGFCSYGVRKKFSKLPFVDTTFYENGVIANTEEQSITLAILPGEEVDEEALKRIVTEAGYDTLAIEYDDE